MQFEVGQSVLVRASRFGNREVQATVLQVLPTTLRVSYSYRDAKTGSVSGACFVRKTNARTVEA